MRMTPRVTLILKRAPSTLAKKIATAWPWEFRESVRWVETIFENKTKWDFLAEPFPLSAAHAAPSHRKFS